MNLLPASLIVAAVLAAGALAIHQQPRPTVPELPPRVAPVVRIEQVQPLASATLAIYWKSPLYPYADRYELWFGEVGEGGVMLTDGLAVVYFPGGDPPMESVPLQAGDEIHENATAIWFVRP